MLDDLADLGGQGGFDQHLGSVGQPEVFVHVGRTFLNFNHFVYGYYAMAAGAFSHQAATSNVRRNIPDPVPVMVLARLAVDHRAQGIKLGASLLQNAVGRAVSVSQNAGVRALLVHALHDRAKQFYEHYGFQESPQHPMTLMLRLNTVKA